ncbi:MULTISPECIES: hypothetical protein [unclassified Devosia]|uniref:hypothetical protein n=1 Tax=unclassified Devosia TaxID=196773 RepID=UPI000966F386|nr:MULTISPECIES: hypothetical protein [unclassified Devosia]MBN9362699.1 hypothetical protein [Devosia sp.]OJX23881.1 MAG: hypothetical protein BGO83_03220 [Devosia sp. 66-14]
MQKIWRKEAGARIEGSRDLDHSKVQAPCIVKAPAGGYRLFYTAVGPGKPFADCQGYILSAVSRDGLRFEPEPGIRVAPDPALPHMALRVLAPSLTQLPDGRWRMYFEGRGRADRLTVIGSAISDDQVSWTVEPGIRLDGGFGAPRFLPLGGGVGRLYVFRAEYADGKRVGTPVVSAITSNGLSFEMEPGYRLRDRTDGLDSAGITAAEVIAPHASGAPWTMLYSAWQDLPPGAVAPVHPSLDADAVANGMSADFAAASIAADMSGYRSRILVAESGDGLNWHRSGIAVEGDGYGGGDIDAVHAEDMSLIDLGDGRYRMYYACCDAHGVWRVASAVSG